MWQAVSSEGKDLINKLLQKDPKKRIDIKAVLDHKWITMTDPAIRELRRKSGDANDVVMQFVAYSNINIEKVKENSPRAAEKSGFQIGSLKDQANVGQSDFMAKMKAKKEAGEVSGSSGLFGKKPGQN